MEIDTELKEYVSTDKKYPYEGIEVAKLEVDKRADLVSLIQTAISTQSEFDETQKLEEDYKEQQPKEI